MLNQWFTAGVNPFCSSTGDLPVPSVIFNDSVAESYILINGICEADRLTNYSFSLFSHLSIWDVFCPGGLQSTNCLLMFCPNH